MSMPQSREMPTVRVQSFIPAVQRAVPNDVRETSTAGASTDSQKRPRAHRRPTRAIDSSSPLNNTRTGEPSSSDDKTIGLGQKMLRRYNPDNEFDVAKAVIYGSADPSAPTTGYTQRERMQRIDAYAGRVVAQVQSIESTSEGGSNVRFQKVCQFLEPAGYFSAGLLAAGHDPHEKISVTFHSYTGFGKPEHLTSTDRRTYFAWEIAAGALAHDKVQRGGPINFQSMQIEAKDKGQVAELESLGANLQSHWEEDIATPMRDASGVLARRSGKADAYLIRGTLQSLVDHKDSFGTLSEEGQKAVIDTLQKNGQAIIPNIYGYPLAGYAFIPYTPYDGDFRHRPNMGVMIDLKNGAVHEISGDKAFASWAKNNQGNLSRSFNASDRQGGRDAHWPKAGDVLQNLIAGNHATYPGYQNLLKDKAVPVWETFNYTGARGSDYRLKCGDLNVGIAAEYQAVNAKNAVWADQTEVFGSSQQNWKSAKDFWGNTFGYLPVIGNTGNIVFGVHDAVYGMTADDRVGGASAAVISGLQLAHEIASVGVGLEGGALNREPSMTQHYGWKYNEHTSDVELVRAPKAPSIDHEVSVNTPRGPAVIPSSDASTPFPGMREVEFMGKKYFVVEKPDAGDGLHYVLRVRDPKNPSELVSSGKIAKPDANGVWIRRGVAGGGVDELAGRLNDPIGFGSRAMVYTDPDDPTYVIKETFPLPTAGRVAEMKNEVQLFNRFYGEGRATFLGSNAADTVSYMRMPKVLGESLESLMAAGKAIPDGVPVGLLNMLAELESAGIAHNDLALRNILYDAQSQKCFPVDFGSAKSAASVSAHSNDRYSIWNLRQEIEPDGQSFDEMVEVLESVKSNAIE